LARQITNNEALEDYVQWSPDGKRLFFRVEQGSVEAKYADLQPRVYSVDVESNKPARWASDFGGSLSHYAVQSNGALLVPGMLGTATALYQQASPQ
jgi:Tol biopolymer transport system component